MDTKTKITDVFAKAYNSFPETRQFINKAFNGACWRKNISVNEEFLISNDSCWYFPVLLYFSVLYYKICYVFCFGYRCKIYLTKTKDKNKQRRNKDKLL